MALGLVSMFATHCFTRSPKIVVISHILTCYIVYIMDPESEELLINKPMPGDHGFFTPIQSPPAGTALSMYDQENRFPNSLNQSQFAQQPYRIGSGSLLCASTPVTRRES
jgi:hypothetical protein